MITHVTETIPIWNLDSFNLMFICRINKDRRKIGVLDNEEEGEKYAEHSLRKFLRTRPPEVMPAVNRFFTGKE